MNVKEKNSDSESRRCTLMMMEKCNLKTKKQKSLVQMENNI